MSRWTLYRLDFTLGEHALAWDALRQRMFSDNPMLDSRFVDALLRHFGDGAELLCIFETGGLPQAMCILRRSSPGIWSTFVPAQAQIGAVLLDRPTLVDSLVRAMPGICGQIDFLCNDPNFGDLSEQDNRQRQSRDHALTMSISISGNFAAYWAGRPKKLIQNIGRYERRLAANSIGLKMVRTSAAEELPAALIRYAQLESNGWKGSEGTALDMEHAQGRFYLDLLRAFARSAEAAVYELWLGERLAASRLTISNRGCVTMLKTTYDESLSEYSPGRLLLHRVVEDMFSRHPDGVIEFYTDATTDQLSWATGQRWIRHVSFCRTAAVSSLLDLLRAGRLALGPKSTTIITSGMNDGPDQIEIYRQPSEFPRDVQNLFAAAETISFDFGVDWYRNLVSTVYPLDSGVRFYVLRRAGQPIAALPVRIERQWGGTKVKSLANFYSALYAPALAPLVKAIDLVPLIHAIRDEHVPFSSFRFDPMDPKSLVYRRLLNALRSAGMVPFQFFCFGNWYLSADSDWPHYLKDRDGSLRNTIKRMGKKFASNGGRLEVVQGGPGLDCAIAAYEQVYAGSWKVPEPYPTFLPELIRTFARRGWLRLGIAWLRDRPIATQVWIVANGKASIYKIAFDEDYKRYAPGTLVTGLLMEHVLDKDHVKEIDYLIGDDKYKQTWMSHRRERWGILAYNPINARGLFGIAREFTGRWFRRISA
jgi:CelD/BcsL family acetyltransferase involved in cellulose biosynthesis